MLQAIGLGTSGWDIKTLTAELTALAGSRSEPSITGMVSKVRATN